jgi:hypothetical protein
MAMSQVQFWRTAKLFLLSDRNALDLSGLRFRFQISANDVETPNIAEIRVYNLSAGSKQEALSEYSTVAINAGYGENPQQIFRGTIKQFRTGKERNVDDFLDIFAADGDVPYNFAVVSEPLKAGSSQQDQFNALAKAAGIPVDGRSSAALSTGGILPRGKVLFGLAKDYFREMARTNNMRWSIQNGALTLIPLDAYLPGTIVKINSATGMIGVPEATEQGISVYCLLNPQIQIGNLLQINNADITATTIKQQFFPSFTDLNLVAGVSKENDGLYRVVVIEHEGDTRGQEWTTHIICLLVDKTAATATPPNPVVQPFG